MSPVRPSKLALARAAELLRVDKPAAREYLRRVQAHAGFAVPYTSIVAAMEEVGTAEETVAERAVALASADAER